VLQLEWRDVLAFKTVTHRQLDIDTVRLVRLTGCVTEAAVSVILCYFHMTFQLYFAPTQVSDVQKYHFSVGTLVFHELCTPSFC